MSIARPSPFEFARTMGARVMICHPRDCWESPMPILPALLILLLLLPVDGSAQSMGGMPQLSPQQIEAARVQCDQLGRMPNPPISVEACKAMLGLGTTLNAAADDPTGRRPGDEAMSCEAIFAELQTLAFAGISEATSARTAAAVADSTALANRQAGELGAFIAESYAMGAVAGAVGAVTPNFVGAAIAAAWQARFAGLAAKQAAEQAPVRAQVNEAILASVGDLNQSIQANPRFARLTQLGMSKGCKPPAAATK
jgi:hypothetical protein